MPTQVVSTATDRHSLVRQQNQSSAASGKISSACSVRLRAPAMMRATLPADIHRVANPKIYTHAPEPTKEITRSPDFSQSTRRIPSLQATEATRELTRSPEVRYRTNYYYAPSETCSTDSTGLIQEIEKHKADHKETLHGLKTALELRMSHLEDRVKKIETESLSQSYTNLIKEFHAHLDEAYARMQTSFETAQVTLEQTGLDLAAKLAYPNCEKKTSLVEDLPQAGGSPNLFRSHRSLDLDSKKVAQKPFVMVQCGRAVHPERMRQQSCPPIVEEKNGRAKQGREKQKHAHGSRSPSSASNPEHLAGHKDFLESEFWGDEAPAWVENALKFIKEKSKSSHGETFGQDQDSCKSSCKEECSSEPGGQHPSGLLICPNCKEGSIINRPRG